MYIKIATKKHSASLSPGSDSGNEFWKAGMWMFAAPVESTITGKALIQ